MAKKSKSVHSEPKYPYTNLPGVLRKILQAIPTKPKPTKVDPALVVSWECSKSVNSNLRAAVAVLKKVGLIASSGEPTPLYVEFMNKATGPTALGAKIREIYADIFNVSHSPQNESDEALEGVFNVHAGGSVDLVRRQMQTFKALCESASFTGAPVRGAGQASGGGDQGGAGTGGGDTGGGTFPSVKIDLHIHLPENKTTRDYEAIIQDIGKYIYGRGVQNGG
ncbi:MAG: DUF5343 domain-containing protein [Phycisphaerales bacterium]|nr:DUF5343 domain-containing protein [Phycisphaerales bacterium]